MKNGKLHSVEIEQFPSIQPLRKINFEKKMKDLKAILYSKKNRVGIELHLIAKKPKSKESQR